MLLRQTLMLHTIGLLLSLPPSQTQVNLHGLDEGMIQKCNYGVLHVYMHHVETTLNMNKTEVKARTHIS